MSYNSNLPADTIAPAEIRENLRALKEDKIVNAATAVVTDSVAKLATARKISLEGDAKGSTSFDGSADVAILVDVVSADTAARVETARTINGSKFDGTEDIVTTAIADGGNSSTVGGYLPNELMPLGGIIMWSGSSLAIPPNWNLCDGNNGTPNLSGKFVLGCSHTHPIGQIGGEETHALTIEEMPEHTHTTTFIRDQCCGITGNAVLGDENRDGTQDVTSQSTGGGGAHNNMPPYYTVAYIMRMG